MYRILFGVFTKEYFEIWCRLDTIKTQNVCSTRRPWRFI